MEAVGVEGRLVCVLYGNLEGSPIHNNNIRTNRMKRAYKVTALHPQIGQTKHEASPVPAQKPLDDMLHKFEDTRQIRAFVKLFTKIPQLRSSDS